MIHKKSSSKFEIILRKIPAPIAPTPLMIEDTVETFFLKLLYPKSIEIAEDIIYAGPPKKIPTKNIFINNIIM